MADKREMIALADLIGEAYADLQKAKMVNNTLFNGYFMDDKPDIKIMSGDYPFIKAYVDITSDYLFNMKEKLEKAMELAEKEAIA